MIEVTSQLNNKAEMAKNRLDVRQKTKRPRSDSSTSESYPTTRLITCDIREGNWQYAGPSLKKP